VQVYPGRNDTTLPFGSCPVWRIAALGGWVVDADYNYDYAVLNPGGAGCRSKGSQTGWFGLSVLNDSTLASYAVDTLGYPGDRGLGLWESDDGWINPTMLPKRIQHSADIWPGQSGAALAGGLRTSCRTCVYAIQSTHSTTMLENQATRIDGDAFTFLQAMRMTETMYLLIIARSSYASPYPAP
jgi:glutamyl endopeptidase